MLELNLPRQFNAARHLIDRNVEQGRGEKTAILSEDRTYTYQQLLEKVNRAANMLIELGVQPENRVMILLQDSPETIFSFYGAMNLGAVPIPTNILMKSQDFLHVLNDSRSAVLIVDSAFLPEIEKILNQARFLKKIIVCGDQNHEYLDFDQLMDRA